MSQIIISCSKSGLKPEKNTECLQLQDLKTGSLLASFKNNSSDSRCITLVGSEFIAIPQSDSSTLHIWSWKKSQPHIKCTMPEKAGSIISSIDGQYCVMGGISGTIYVWQVATGHLLKSWEGHYKKVTCLSFTEDDSFLVSGGEDATIHVWNISSILHSFDSSVVKPYSTWSDHSLSITSLYCGFGGMNGRIVSTSKDRTCKIWDIPSKTLLATLVFPTGIECCCMDNAERFLFAGGIDGKIYGVHLFASYSITDAALKESPQTLYTGHTQPITSLGVSWDGMTLVSGSLDGSIKLWDTLSCQVLKTFTNHKGPITSLLLAWKPSDLLQSDKKITAPIQTFKKFSPTEVLLPINFGNHAPSSFQHLSFSWDSNERNSGDLRLIKKARIIQVNF
eukprot:TRINITY_DN3599_c0_g1_i2.p1 TRINITY_DN3599_c0_g1~~TRINITY_DN3599_c0_g1_i2.p1  ORF type:complete len:408 (-),score=73.25 TRINITY_DN3599_c0_g1_i2:177-1355(-)